VNVPYQKIYGSRETVCLWLVLETYRCPIYPLKLIRGCHLGRKARFLKTLIFNKKKPHSQEGEETVGQRVSMGFA
jgi:hypothetical protein